MLIIRHGRSRVRHSSEKNHIRWGLQAFDNLTLYDYDYENANGTGGSNETLFDFGLSGGGSGGGNQTFLGSEPFGYYSSEMVFNNGTTTGSNSGSSNESRLISTLAPSPSSSNRWSASMSTSASTSASTSTLPAKNQKLAKKQFMESIRKNVEEGIEYLRTHAHLSQPTAVMPSEKALLQLQKQAEQFALAEKQKTMMAHSDETDSKSSGSAESAIPISKHFKSSFAITPFGHAHATEHNPLNQKKRQFDKQLPLWRAHQIDEINGNTNRIEQSRHNANQFDDEMQNDETYNQNVHDSDIHPYKSNKLNKSGARHAHESSSSSSSSSTASNGRANSIATMKTIDSIVTSINAAEKISKKYFDQATAVLNDAKPNLNGNSNVTRSNFRSQGNNSKLTSRIQSANEKRNELKNGHGKSADVPISSVASLTSHADDTVELSTKQNDSNVKFTTNLNNQFEGTGFLSPFDELNDEQQANDDNGDETNPFTFDSNYEQTMTFDGKMANTNGDGIQLSIFQPEDLDDLDEISRNNRINLMRGRDVVTKFLQIVESQHLLGANCTAGTALNLGEGVVDRYAQDRFRVEAEVAVNRANWLTR